MNKAGNNDTEQGSSIVLNYTASSLYSVIAGGTYNATNAGRVKWMSLVNDDENNTSVKDPCSKEGFNINAKSSSQQLNIRIGWVGYNDSACETPNSFIGFGIGTKGDKWYSGNIGSHRGKSMNTTGYILVQ